MKLAGLLMFINDVHSLGLKTTQGMYLTDSWYWDQNAETRAWSRKFFEKMKRMPSSLQAADYSATLQLPEGGEGRRQRRHRQGDGAHAQDAKINDMYAKNGTIRARRPHGARHVPDAGEDARGESKEPWDYFKVVADDPGRRGLHHQGRDEVRALEVMQPAAVRARRAGTVRARFRRAADGSA